MQEPTYGTAILSARSVRRLSQGDLAKRVGITVQTLIDIEYDRIEITEATYNRIVQALEMESDQPTESAA